MDGISDKETYEGLKIAVDLMKIMDLINESDKFIVITLSRSNDENEGFAGEINTNIPSDQVPTALKLVLDTL